MVRLVQSEGAKSFVLQSSTVYSVVNTGVRLTAAPRKEVCYGSSDYA